MRARELFQVGLTLFGLYLIVRGLESVVYYVSKVTVYNSYTIQVAHGMVVSLNVGMARMAIGVILFFGGERLARWMFRQ